MHARIYRAQVLWEHNIDEAECVAICIIEGQTCMHVRLVEHESAFRGLNAGVYTYHSVYTSLLLTIEIIYMYQRCMRCGLVPFIFGE